MTNEEYKKELTRYWDSIRDKKSGMMGQCNCVSVKCCNCMLSKICTIQRFNQYADAFEAVELIEQWSKEHPIKTNGQVAKELLEERFGITTKTPTRCEIISCNNSCIECEYKGFWSKEYKER